MARFESRQDQNFCETGHFISNRNKSNKQTCAAKKTRLDFKALLKLKGSKQGHLGHH